VHQLSIPIKAEGAPEGQYGFRVEVYSTDAPGEEYAISNMLAFKVLGKKIESVKEAPKIKKFPMWIIAVVVGVLVVVGGMTAWLMTGGDIQVPDLVGMSSERAKKVLDKRELALGAVTEQLTGKVAAGTVLSQNPEAKAKVGKNSGIDLVVEAVSVSVPRVVSMPLETAKAILEEEELKPGTVAEQSTGRAAAGTVLSQKPEAKAKVAKDSAIDLVVEAVSVSVPKPANNGPALSVKGYNVIKVKDSRGVTWAQVGDKTWNEIDTNGRKAFDFHETGRDEWSVYLIDNSRVQNPE